MPAISSSDGPVALTGASGYVGAQIALNLVDHGYTVRCCVRDANNPLKTSHLLAMNSYGAPGQLTLHIQKGRLLKAGSEYVFFVTLLNRIDPQVAHRLLQQQTMYK